MKKIITLVMIGLLFISCSSNDDGIDCSLFDPQAPSLFLKLVDSNGTNLIENGTIDPDEISILQGGDFRFNPPHESANSNEEISEFDNTLQLFLRVESTEYVIQLSETETISLDFSAELEELACNVSFYIPTAASSNGEDLEIREVLNQAYLVEMEL